MIHYHILLAHWISHRYTSLSYWPNGYFYGQLPSPICLLIIPMVNYYLLLAHWISLGYTTIYYWPNVYLYCTLPSPTGPLDISMVHCYLLLAHWISLWYTTIFYWISQRYTTLSYWPNGYLYGTPPSHIGPLTIPMVHYFLLPTHFISLWYTTLSY